jgi:hypothetical protein
MSAAVLDRQRLGKQRAEVVQLLEALDDPGNRTHNHPACKMWRGHRHALAVYGVAVCDEWVERGYRDNTREKIAAHRVGPDAMPAWLGRPEFHASHRAALLRKEPSWYGAFGWAESPLLPYVWPLPAPASR